MGFINKILPNKLKPISRDIGFTLRTLVYTLKCISKKPYPDPIFILGNQKSGTTAIAVLLGKLTKKRTAIDLFYSGFKASPYLNWKNKTISTTKFINENILEFNSEIIKEPHLSVFYKELKQKYPKSRFLIIVRNPFDNIRSILDRLNVNGDKLELTKQEKKAFFHSWKLLLDNSWIGGSKKHYIDVLAERWNIIIDCYYENQEEMHLIKYEDFILDKNSVLKNIASTLNLDPKNDVSGILDRQYQPKGQKRNIAVKDFFGEENFLRIEKICKENLKRLGYIN